MFSPARCRTDKNNTVQLSDLAISAIAHITSVEQLPSSSMGHRRQAQGIAGDQNEEAVTVIQLRGDVCLPDIIQPQTMFVTTLHAIQLNTRFPTNTTQHPPDEPSALRVSPPSTAAWPDPPAGSRLPRMHPSCPMEPSPGRWRADTQRTPHAPCRRSGAAQGVVSRQASSTASPTSRGSRACGIGVGRGS